MPINLNSSRANRNSDTGATMIIRAMDPKVYQKRANFAAFVTLLRLMQMRRTAAASNRSGMLYGSKLQNVDNPKFEWSNLDIGTPVDTLNGAVGGTTGDTAVVVDNIGMWTAGDIAINTRTKERVLVTAVTAGTSTLTVTRQWGASDALAAPSAAAMLDGDTLALVGNAFEEGAAAPSPLSFDPDEFFNYTQIFRRSTGGTKTNQATKFYGDVNKIEFQKRMVWDLFLKDRSAAYYRGVRNKTTGTNSQPLRTTGGLEQWITTNLMELDGAVTYNDFIDFAAMVYGYGGEEKTMLCNTAMSSLLQKEVFSNKAISIDVSPNSKEFGIAIKRIVTIHGNFDFMEDKTLNELYPETMAVGFCLEMPFIEDMILRPDQWEENIQTPGTDGRTDQVIGESGLKVVNEERHGIITVDLS